MCQQIDNLEYYFLYCHDTKYFWNQVEKWLCNLFTISVNLKVLGVLLGVVNFDVHYCHVINYVILMGKYFIYKSKKKQKDLFFYNFQYTLRSRLQIDEKVYVQQGRLDLFEKKFGILLDNL